MKAHAEQQISFEDVPKGKGKGKGKFKGHRKGKFQDSGGKGEDQAPWKGATKEEDPWQADDPWQAAPKPKQMPVPKKRKVDPAPPNQDDLTWNCAEPPPEWAWDAMYFWLKGKAKGKGKKGIRHAKGSGRKGHGKAWNGQSDEGTWGDHDDSWDYHNDDAWQHGGSWNQGVTPSWNQGAGSSTDWPASSSDWPSSSSCRPQAWVRKQ